MKEGILITDTRDLLLKVSEKNNYIDYNLQYFL